MKVLFRSQVLSEPCCFFLGTSPFTHLHFWGPLNGKITWTFFVILVAAMSSFAQEKRPATIALPARALDDQVGFKILVWQYRNDAKRDAQLYRQVNLSGFHIDYGEGQKSRAVWAKRENWPYYVDHAAGKGILHLTPRSGLGEIPRDGQPAARPWSFFNDQTKKELLSRLKRNVPPIASGPVLAIALDDEVSLGTFNSPLEVDYSEPAVQAFRKWLPTQYRGTAQLRDSWGLKSQQTPSPVPFERVRAQIQSRPPSEWKLARWMDFRSFMDQSQADMFADLVRATNLLAPGVPVGVVGGQQPSAYGGFDYARLRDSLQWTEAYDIGGTNEILHSFWSSAPRRGRMQTYFLSGNLSQDKWFLWYYLAHGNRGVIAWPDMKRQPWFQDGKIHPHVKKLADTFKQVQKDSLGVLAHPDTEPVFSPIAILYSHPSVQLGWAIDATAHGKTWPRRSSSLDNSCLSSGKNRVAWTRLMEDLGYQAKFVDTQELLSGSLTQAGCKVLLLPQAFALSRDECDAIKKFAEQGGLVIADYGTAITDEHGNGYRPSPVDEMFGIDRSKDQGWFDGTHRYEINGEAYQQPFLKRFARDGIQSDKNLVLVERSVGGVLQLKKVGVGKAVFLNSSPTQYFDAKARAGEFGARWRELLQKQLEEHNVVPEVRISRKDGNRFGVELLRYRTRDRREIWAITTNPTRQGAIDNAGSGIEFSPNKIDLVCKSDRPISQIRDLRTGKIINSEFQLPADEALILEVSYE